MKKITLLFILIFSVFIKTPSATIDVNVERLYKNYILEKYKGELNNYTKDVGIKYTYSSRAKNFLTNENLNLIIRNCESFPSVILAMAIIETGWGKYPIGNNYFGIKGKGHVRITKEWNGKSFITIKSSFKKFSSKEDNIRAVSNLLHNNKRYNLRTATDYIEAAHMVKNGGYATDPLYVFKIKFIIEKYELYRLDEIKNNYNKLI